MEIQDVTVFRLLTVGLAAGLLFAVMDGLINANPVAQRLYAFYRPIVRESVNAPLGVLFDLVSGIVMAILFVTLKPAFPGGWAFRGIAFGLLAWFFRVAMGSASQAVMFRIPASALVYSLLTGLAEMVALGLFYGALLKPR
ncbi:MAG TPA: hypothetical protein VMJ34_14485 [Bryobacteraceae bacterium]|nr:hypothetical protein [Bryobacteraceae bacterium]